MAFPAIRDQAFTSGGTATASAVVTLPASIVAGDTLLVLHRSAIGTAAHGYPLGWTALFNDASDASDDRISCAWRKADGLEDASITVTQTSSKFASISWSISGAADPTVTPPQFATLVTGTSTLPDPGALTPTGGAKDYLWLWVGGWEGEQTSPPAGNPTNYALGKAGANSGTGGAVATNCRVASAGRQLNAATENPPSWTISASDDWTASVVAVHPVGGITAADGNASGVAASSVAGAALATALSAAAGVAASAVAGVALWLTVVTSPGIATVSGVGGTVFGSPGTSAGVAASSVVGVGIGASGASAAGIGTPTGTSGATAGAPGSAAGLGVPTGIGAALWLSDGTSAGLGTPTGLAAALWLADSVAAGLAAGLSVSAAFWSVLGAAVGVAVATGDGEAVGGAAGYTGLLPNVLRYSGRHRSKEHRGGGP